MRSTVCIPQMDVQWEINKTIFHLYQWEGVMQFAWKSKPYKETNQEEIYNFIIQLGSVYSKLIINKLTHTKGNLHKIWDISACKDRMGIKLRCCTSMIQQRRFRLL